MLVNTNKKISDPKISDVVFFQPWGSKTDWKKKAYPVLIKSGCYRNTTFHTVTNFWDWQPLTPTGKPKGKLQHGYGNFTIATGWQTEVRIIVSKD